MNADYFRKFSGRLKNIFKTSAKIHQIRVHPRLILTFDYKSRLRLKKIHFAEAISA